MSRFFVGQRVRIISAPACPSLVGQETIIVNDGIEIDGIEIDCWILGIPNLGTGTGWLCRKDGADKYITPILLSGLEAATKDLHEILPFLRETVSA